MSRRSKVSCKIPISRGVFGGLIWTIVLVTHWMVMFYISENEHAGSDSNQTEKLWFVETGFHRRLNGRQACAIESASLHNPTLLIHLLTTEELSADCDYLRVLSHIPNFRWTKMNLGATFHSTPLECWYGSLIWMTGHQPAEDLSDALRYTVLWKEGGIYLDLDVISTRSLLGLKNCAVYQSGTIPASGILFFDKGHGFLLNVLRTCAMVYDPFNWGSCGPPLMHRVSKTKSSQGVKFLNASSFLAVPFQDWRWFFEPNFTARALGKVRNSYGVHVWNKLSNGVSVAVGSGTAYDVLARSNCPRVYELMRLNKKEEKERERNIVERVNSIALTIP